MQTPLQEVMEMRFGALPLQEMRQPGDPRKRAVSALWGNEVVRELRHILPALLISFVMFFARSTHAGEKPIGMAVEFMDHAACAYVAKHMGWYEEAGLSLTTYES